MADNTLIWRIQTRVWKDREGKEHTDETLVAPRYYVTLDRGVTGRAAKPKMPTGKFSLKNNSNELLVVDEKGREFFGCMYERLIEEDRPKIIPEEALGVCMAAMDVLNGTKQDPAHGWKVKTLTWKAKDGSVQTAEGLVAPGEEVVPHEGLTVTVRDAVPWIPVGKFKAPFEIWSGTCLHVQDKHGESLLTCSYAELDYASGIWTGVFDPDEALGACMAVVDMLNGEKGSAK